MLRPIYDIGLIKGQHTVMVWSYLLLTVACQGKEEGATSQRLARGEQLAQAHCRGCHRWTPPAALSQQVWREGVLPVMAHYLGIHESPSAYDKLFETGRAGQRVRQAAVFPPEPRLSTDDWQAIRAYYEGEAPDSLTAIRETPKNLPADLFKAVLPPFRLAKPLVSLVTTHGSRVVVGDVKRDASQLTFLDRGLQEQYQLQVPEAPVQLISTDRGFYVLCMGRMYPSDAAQGQLIAVQETVGADQKRHFKASRVLEQLQRPVQVVLADLDGDQDDDWVVCEFGYRTGRFGWYEQTGATYRYHELQNGPGAIRAAVQDFTSDGRPDLLVLFAQGDERLMLYTNQGDGSFIGERLLRFSPVAGSTGFELIDWNGDGYPDILYTCGDNADHSQEVKPYHGIKLFVNDGSNHFTEAFFLEHHGAYQAHAADYDGDGDLDIAAISFFPDYEHRPGESFVFYQNDGQDQFTQYSPPEATQGRWIRMLSYDYEGDGDEDILLGSFVGLPPGGGNRNTYQDWMSNNLPTLLLKNQAIVANQDTDR